MFKKLFGIKKNKVETLEEAKAALLENIKEPNLNKDMPKSLEQCFEFFENSPKEVIEAIKSEIFSLIDTPVLGQSVHAFSVYTSILEHAYISEGDIPKVIELYKGHLVKSLPFFELLDKEVKKGEEGENELDLDGLYSFLIKDREQVAEEVAKSVVLIDNMTQNLINIISLNPSYIRQAEEALSEQVRFVKDYNQGVFWMERLFETLFDEPIVVIDVDKHIGIEGKMSGVNDNAQLQLLLMGMSELNEIPLVNGVSLAVVNGTGPHVSPSVTEGKWNMYNYDIVKEEGWHEIKIGPAKTLELESKWVSLQGAPSEISVHDGKRVLLLGRPTYKRQMRVQRTFKNLRADITVEKILSEEEVDSWLGIKA